MNASSGPASKGKWTTPEASSKYPVDSLTFSEVPLPPVSAPAGPVSTTTRTPAATTAAMERSRRARRSARAEDPVTGIAEARHDVADLVQTFVDRRCPDGDIWVGLLEGSDPLWSG